MEIKKFEIGDIDVLNRHGDIELLISIVNSINEKPFVLSINAPWGSGKTWLLKELKKKLESLEIKVMYYNVWENELISDMIASFIGEIYSFLKMNCFAFQNDENKKKFEHILLTFCKLFSAAIAKKLTGIPIDITSISNYSESISKGIESLLVYEIDNVLQKKDTIQKFRENLGYYSKEMYKDKIKPFVIMIDELDRCSSKYVISFLEMIKHFFDIENIFFIIAIDKNQINESIIKEYGENTNVDGFLRKIIDMQYSIELSSITEYYFIAQKMLDLNNRRDDKIEPELQIMLQAFNLSIRDIEKLILNIQIAYLLYPEKDTRSIHYLLILFLSLLKIKNNRLYNTIQKKEKTIFQIFEEIIAKYPFVITNVCLFEWITRYIIMYFSNSEDEYIENCDKIRNLIYSKGITDRDLVFIPIPLGADSNNLLFDAIYKSDFVF